MASAKGIAEPSWQHRPEHLPSEQGIVRLKPELAKRLYFLTISFLFVPIGVCLILDGRACGWFVAPVFGIGVLVSALGLLPGCAYLELRPDGFEVCSLFRPWFCTWEETEVLGTFSMAHTRWVGIRFIPVFDRARILRRMNRAVAGLDGCLPDTYGMKAEELADLMRLWRDYHLSRKADQPARDGAC